MDPYAPCPCGSGKKVKFCCQKLLPEMEKVERLQDNQPDQALIHLNRLEQSSPGNPWVVTTRAGVLMQMGEFPDAKLELLKFLKEHPDHPRANALYAFAAFHADGFPACKKAVHRAFKRCIAETPRIVSSLMEALGEHHYISGNLLAARAHLMLALRVAPVEEDRDRVLRSIMRFDSDSAIPFLLRGGQALPQYEPPEGARETFDKARHLSLLACWEEAADLLETLTEQDPQSAALWHTLGLFRAWDGDEESAAEALQKAALLYGDGPTAVECMTLALFLQRSHTDNVIPMRLQRYDVTSVSQLLSRLDDNPHFARSDDGAELPRGAGAPVAMYLVLDRPLPKESELPHLTGETVPLYLGRVLVFDGNPEDDVKPLAFLSGLEGEQLSAAAAAFTAAAGELVQRKPVLPADASDEAPADVDSELDVLGEIDRDELPLHRNYFIPPGTPAPLRTALQTEHWRKIETELWPHSPQQALGGKSPAQAAGDPALRLTLEAAVLLFQAFADARQQLLPIQALRQQLQLSPPIARKLDEGAAAGLSNFDLERLDLPSLQRAELEELIVRLQMSQHPRLLYAVALEWAARNFPDPPSENEQALRAENIFGLLAMLATQFGRAQEALDWIDKGRQLPTAADQRFEKQLNWKLRELRVRTQFFAAEELKPLLKDLWDNFGTKIPSLRAQLQEVAATLKIDPPWQSSIVTGGQGWFPAPAAAAAGEPAKSLWLPGQS